MKVKVGWTISPSKNELSFYPLLKVFGLKKDNLYATVLDKLQKDFFMTLHWWYT